MKKPWTTVFEFVVLTGAIKALIPTHGVLDFQELLMAAALAWGFWITRKLHGERTKEPTVAHQDEAAPNCATRSAQ